MHLSGESLAGGMDGKVAVWTQRRATWRSNLEGWLIKKGFGVQIQSLKGERSLVLACWLGKLVLALTVTSPCLPKVRLLFVALSLILEGRNTFSD